jgi:ABC-type multidrug transport system ATPase subunit
LKIRALVAFQAATQPHWNDVWAAVLMERLEVDPTMRVDRLSRGQQARLSLIFALSHDPDLLLLDDPTLDLDPSGRRLFLGEMLGAAEAPSWLLLSPEGDATRLDLETLLPEKFSVYRPKQPG